MWHSSKISSVLAFEEDIQPIFRVKDATGNGATFNAKCSMHSAEDGVKKLKNINECYNDAEVCFTLTTKRLTMLYITPALQRSGHIVCIMPLPI